MIRFPGPILLIRVIASGVVILPVFVSVVGLKVTVPEALVKAKLATPFPEVLRVEPVPIVRVPIFVLIASTVTVELLPAATETLVLLRSASYRATPPGWLELLAKFQIPA